MSDAGISHDTKGQKATKTAQLVIYTDFAAVHGVLQVSIACMYN
jgi:hypothetical protein